MDPTKFRTRYAPSPTGFLHIGGARTALFCFLFARSTNGTFILRIEDTDTERNVEGGIASQFDNLAWLGVIPDESLRNPGKHGPYLTSEKLPHYVDLAHKLLASGHAYECFCTQERLEQDRENAEKNHLPPRYSKRCRFLTAGQKEELRNKVKPVIRLKMEDDREYQWNDLVRGPVSFPGSSLSDFVLIRSSGVATYNFAVSVDDIEMDITHVLRGEEHIANTPYQVAVREAFGITEADGLRFGHLSVITDETHKKLSKRNKELKQFIEDYRNDGYPSEGIANFLALLGWSPEDNKEIRSLKELEQVFKLEHVSKSPAIFDVKKLQWVCSEHIKRMTDPEYLTLVHSIKNSPALSQPRAWIDEALLLYKPQVSCAKEALDHVLSLQAVLLDPDRSFYANATGETKPVLDAFAAGIKGLSDWSEPAIKEVIKQVKTTTGANGKNLFMPIRLATTGKEHGAELPRLLYLLGKERVLASFANE